MKTFSAFISFIATSDEPITHFSGFRQCAIGKFGEEIGHNSSDLGNLFRAMGADVVAELKADFPLVVFDSYPLDNLNHEFTRHQQITHASVQAIKLLSDLNDSDMMHSVAPTMNHLRAYIARTYPLIPTN